MEIAVALAAIGIVIVILLVRVSQQAGRAAAERDAAEVNRGKQTSIQDASKPMPVGDDAFIDGLSKRRLPGDPEVRDPSG